MRYGGVRHATEIKVEGAEAVVDAHGQKGRPLVRVEEDVGRTSAEMCTSPDTVTNPEAFQETTWHDYAVGEELTFYWCFSNRSKVYCRC